MKMIDVDKLYPLLFEPQYESTVWGGDAFKDKLQRKLPAKVKNAGESWEIADRPGRESVVTNGPLAGAALNELLLHYRGELMGRRFTGERFPLIVKLMDVADKTSIQVHPDEVSARESGSEAKTLMWYVITAEKGAKILAGLNSRATRRQLTEPHSSTELEQMMQSYHAQSGDAYFIQGGVLHGVIGGALLLEISQNSESDLRFNDWERQFAGKERELHKEEAIKIIDFTNRASTRIPGACDERNHNRKYAVINHCRHFKVDDLKLTAPWRDTTLQSGSFHLITAVNRPIVIASAADNDLHASVPSGSTALIPFAMGAYVIEPQENNGTTTVLKCTLNH